MSRGQSKNVSDNVVLRAIQNHDDRAVTTKEMADQLGYTAQGMLKRLNALNERGEIVKKSVGSRAVVWWITDYDGGDTRSFPDSDNQ